MLGVRTVALGSLLFALALPFGCADEPSESVPTTALPDLEVANSDLRILDLSTGVTRAVAVTDRSEEWPTWSPDGRRLAFHRWTSGGRVEGETDLWTVDVETSQERVALSRAGVEVTASWSPDGERLVFMAKTSDGDADVWSLDLASGVVSQLTSGRAGDFLPALSPDGSQLAVLRWSDHQGVAIQDVGSLAEPRIITPSDVEVSAFAWSPTGDAIAYVATRENELPRLWIVSLDEADMPREVSGPTAPAWLTWSPDGGSLAFSEAADGHLYRIDVRTGVVTQLTDGTTDDLEPSWSPDGRLIAYAAYPNPPRIG